MVELFLDSGAFSAMTKGVKIDIDKYIEFIKEWQPQGIDVYACLDVIGDPIKTQENQIYMESKGLKPLITFHNKEDYKWLEKYVNEYEYIAIGGIAKTGIKKSQMLNHLDKCWSIICNKNGIPKCKVHGFGITAIDMLFRYPWYSVDSTSWVLTGRFGSVFVPKYRDGQYIYNENSWKVSVSNQSPDQKTDGQHFTNFSPMEQEVITQYFDLKGFKIGKSEYRSESKKTYKLKNGERWLNSDSAACRELIEEMDVYVPPANLATAEIIETVIESGLSNDYKQRDELNIIYFLDLEREFRQWPWPFKNTRNQGFGFNK